MILKIQKSKFDHYFFGSVKNTYISTTKRTINYDAIKLYRIALSIYLINSTILYFIIGSFSSSGVLPTDRVQENNITVYKENPSVDIERYIVGIIHYVIDETEELKAEKLLQ